MSNNREVERKLEWAQSLLSANGKKCEYCCSDAIAICRCGTPVCHPCKDIWHSFEKCAGCGRLMCMTVSVMQLCLACQHARLVFIAKRELIKFEENI